MPDNYVGSYDSEGVAALRDVAQWAVEMYRTLSDPPSAARTWYFTEGEPG